MLYLLSYKGKKCTGYAILGFAFNRGFFDIILPAARTLVNSFPPNMEDQLYDLAETYLSHFLLLV